MSDTKTVRLFGNLLPPADALIRFKQGSGANGYYQLQGSDCVREPYQPDCKLCVHHTFEVQVDATLSFEDEVNKRSFIIRAQDFSDLVGREAERI